MGGVPQAVLDRIVVRPVRRVEEGRLWTPPLRAREFDTHSGKMLFPSECIVYEVVAVGPHVRDPDIKPGVKVVSSWVHGVSWKYRGEEYVTLEEREVYGIWEDDRDH